MAARNNLREYQARLSERLRQASTTGRAAHLGVQIGERPLLVDLSDAGEIVAPNCTITPVPLTHDWFRGLVNLRGSLYGVSDLARLQGGDPTPMTKSTRLLAFSARLGVNAAIVVDRMLGLQNVATMTEEAGEDESTPSWLGRRWVDADGQRWTELRLEELVSDERFLAVNR